MAAKDDLGRRGEDLATQFLVDLGYAIIDRNWRARGGELDIVAQDADTTVFVEVKTRSGVAFGHPFEAITAPKLARLRRLAMAWCDANLTERRRGPVRIDAIAVIAPRGVEPRVEHLKRVG